MGFLDFGHTFFRPVWRRVGLVVVCLGWSIFEFLTAAPFWGVVFGAFGLYAAWQFCTLSFDLEDDENGEK